jgi:hypothetical protein
MRTQADSIGQPLRRSARSEGRSRQPYRVAAAPLIRFRQEAFENTPIDQMTAWIGEVANPDRTVVIQRAN